MAWTTDLLTGPQIEEADSEGDIFTITFSTPAGRVWIIGAVELEDLDDGRRRIVLRGAHMHSESGARSVGVSNLRAMAELLLERTHYDEVLIEGGARTTGAYPGHTPRPLRFTRRRNTSEGG